MTLKDQNVLQVREDEVVEEAVEEEEEEESGVEADET